MKILINGRNAEFESPPSLAQIVDRMGFSGIPVAVAVNYRCVPRSELATTIVSEGDEIEILSPQAGG